MKEMAITGGPHKEREVQLTAKAREDGKDEIIYPERYLNHCICRVCQLSSPLHLLLQHTGTPTLAFFL